MNQIPTLKSYFLCFISTIFIFNHVQSQECSACERAFNRLTCPNSFRMQYELKFSTLPNRNPDNQGRLLRFDCHRDLDLSLLQGCSFPDVRIAKIVYFDCNFRKNDTLFNLFSQMGVDSSQLQNLIFQKWGSGAFPESLDATFLEGFLNLTSLTIEDTNFISLSPGSFLHTPNLMSLKLKRNDLKTIPEDIFSNLPILVNLTLESNKLKDIPSGIFESVSSVENINLISNELETLHPDLFLGLTNLKIIYLGRNKLSTLPEDLFVGNPNLIVADLSSNDLELLPSSIFRENLKLERILLKRNKITSIPDDFFSKFKFLAELDLSSNKLMTLSPSLLSSNKNLKKLALSRNAIETLDKDFLTMNTLLEVAMLDNNNLTQAPSFEYNPQITKIYLQKNNIQSMTDISLPRNDDCPLEILNLAHNKITENGTRMSGTLPKLREIDLSHNNIHANPLGAFGLQLFKSLEKVDLSGNNVSHLNLYLDFLGMAKNVSYDFSGNQISSIILPFDWNNTTSQNKFTISLSRNNLSCDCRSYQLANLLRTQTKTRKNIFIQDGDSLKCGSGNPHNLINRTIISLDLKDFICHDIPKCPELCSCFYIKHSNFLTVNCSFTDLKIPPEFSIINPSFLYSMDLSNNQIQKIDFTAGNYGLLRDLNLRGNSIESQSLKNVKSLPQNLTKLDLRDNDLENLPDEFLQVLNDSQASLWLADNPWKCDCNQRNFLKFIQTNLDRVEDKGAIRCGDTGMFLLDLKVDDLCPFYEDSSFIAGASVLVLVILLTSISATVLFYKHKRDILVWLYAHKLFLPCVTQNELDTDKKYDAFVSFAHEDSDYVVQLEQKLENEDHKFKLCIHYRDWLAGEYIHENIISSIKDSRRTIILLSRNFVKSQWGQAEFKQASQLTFSDLINRIIVIVLDELPPEDEMDPELLDYIKKRTYLEWKNPKFWDQLRYAMPHHKNQYKKKRKYPVDKIELVNGNSVQSVAV